MTLAVTRQNLTQTAAVSVEARIVASGTTDDQLVSMWIHGKSPHTQRAYRADADRFLAFVARPLRMVTLADLQAFADSLQHGASRRRATAVVKSLLSFGQRTGYLPVNVGAVLPIQTPKDTLGERILDEKSVHALLVLEPNPRNRLLLRLMYRAGLRLSEVTGLKWRDFQARDEGGQLTIFGKGSKTRMVLLPTDIWRDLVATRNSANLDAPVFASRKGGGHLDPTAIERIVWKAAERAGLEGKVSPHWLRHAHATHALERGAPIHLVQSTLGHASVATTGRYLHARPTDSSARFTSG
jgi:integrase/recombinase XerD